MELIQQILFSGLFVVIYGESITTSSETGRSFSAHKIVKITDLSLQVSTQSDLAKSVRPSQPIESSLFVTSFYGITSFLSSSIIIESGQISISSFVIENTLNPSKTVESSPLMITSSEIVKSSSQSTDVISSIVILPSPSSEMSQPVSPSKTVESTGHLSTASPSSKSSSLLVDTKSYTTTLETSFSMETIGSSSLLISDYMTILSSSISINCTQNCTPKSRKAADSKHTGTVIVVVMFFVMVILVLVGTFVYWRKRRCGHYGIRTPVASYKIFRDDDSERVTLN